MKDPVLEQLDAIRDYLDWQGPLKGDSPPYNIIEILAKKG